MSYKNLLKKIYKIRFLQLHKKKIGIAVGSTIILFFITYFTYSIMKIDSLSKKNAFDSLEIYLLRESLAVFRENKEKDREAVKKLSKRVDNIIQHGSDFEISNNYIYGVATISGETTTVASTPSSASPTPFEASFSRNQKITHTITPTYQPLESLGRLEIYDPVRKTVAIYKEPSTIAITRELQVGQTVSYFKKQTDWYLIQLQDSSDEQWWINKKYIRGIQ